MRSGVNTAPTTATPVYTLRCEIDLGTFLTFNNMAWESLAASTQMANVQLTRLSAIRLMACPDFKCLYEASSLNSTVPDEYSMLCAQTEKIAAVVVSAVGVPSIGTLFTYCTAITGITQSANKFIIEYCRSNQC